VLEGIQSDSESSGVGCDLEMVDDTERAELADVQDGCGGELGVSFGWGDDEVELWMSVGVYLWWAFGPRMIYTFVQMEVVGTKARKSPACNAL
jgi:hypothetical protein